jgi:hypothetical protein
MHATETATVDRDLLPAIDPHIAGRRPAHHQPIIHQVLDVLSLRRVNGNAVRAPDAAKRSPCSHFELALVSQKSLEKGVKSALYQIYDHVAAFRVRTDKGFKSYFGTWTNIDDRRANISRLHAIVKRDSQPALLVRPQDIANAKFVPRRDAAEYGFSGASHLGNAKRAFDCSNLGAAVGTLRPSLGYAGECRDKPREEGQWQIANELNDRHYMHLLAKFRTIAFDASAAHLLDCRLPYQVRNCDGFPSSFRTLRDLVEQLLAIDAVVKGNKPG